jgi:hypothetical protein
MLRKLGLSTAVVALLVGCQDGELPTQPQHEAAASVSTSSTAPIVPTQRFVRGAGEPAFETVQVTIPAGLQEATLRVVNGSARGENRVSSATILLDGEAVLRPSDLSQNVAQKLTAVRVTEGQRQLSVQVAGRPGAFLDITLERGAPVGPQGGTLSLDGGDVTVVVPQGAVRGDVVITADPVPASQEGTLGAYDFGPDGTRFEKPITITLPYPASLQGVSAADLALYWKDETTGNWLPLQNPVVNTQERTVSGQIDHFTVIGILASEVRACADGTGAPTLKAALDAVSTWGRVRLCDGPIPSGGAVAARPMTIEPETGASPVLVGSATEANGVSILVSGYSEGTVSVRGLAFRGHRSAITAAGRYHRVYIERSHFFTDHPGNSNAVFAGASTVANAMVTIDEVDVVGGNAGLFAAGSTSFRVYNSRVTGQVGSGIQLQGGAHGAVVANTVTECGHLGCIRIRFGGVVNVSDNTVRTSARLDVLPAGVQFGIVADGQRVWVYQNLVEGLATSFTDPDDIRAYSIRDAGIYVLGNNGAPTEVIVTGNRVSGAFSGLSADGQHPVTLTGNDNVVDRNGVAVRVRGGASVQLRRNDFTNHVLAITHSNAPDGSPSLASGDLTCNWWGDASGPSNFGGTAFPAGAYTPWATAPIAGTRRSC